MCFPRAFICGFNEIAHQRWKTANPDPIQRRGNLSRGDTEQNPRLIFGLTGLAQDHFLVFNITAYSTGICFQSQIFQIKYCKKMRHTAKSRITFYHPFRDQDTTGKTELRGFLKPSFSFHPPWLVFLERGISFELVKTLAPVNLSISEMSQGGLSSWSLLQGLSIIPAPRYKQTKYELLILKIIRNMGTLMLMLMMLL